MRTWDMWKVCLQTFRNNTVCQKLAYFLRNLQTSRANNSRVLRVKNAKFSRCCFYMNTNIYENFQVCISVPINMTVTQNIKRVLILFLRIMHRDFRSSHLESSTWKRFYWISFLVKIAYLITAFLHYTSRYVSAWVIQ